MLKRTIGSIAAFTLAIGCGTFMMFSQSQAKDSVNITTISQGLFNNEKSEDKSYNNVESVGFNKVNLNSCSDIPTIVMYTDDSHREFKSTATDKNGVIVFDKSVEAQDIEEALEKIYSEIFSW